MQPKRDFLKAYLYLALAFGLLQLIDGILSLLEIDNPVAGLLVSLLFLFFLFNIVVIPIFHHYRVERIAYVLPIFYLLSYLILTGVSLLLILGSVLSLWAWCPLMVLNVLFAIFIIGFSVYLLRKPDFV